MNVRFRWSKEVRRQDSLFRGALTALAGNDHTPPVCPVPSGCHCSGQKTEWCWSRKRWQSVSSATQPFPQIRCCSMMSYLLGFYHLCEFYPKGKMHQINHCRWAWKLKLISSCPVSTHLCGEEFPVAAKFLRASQQAPTDRRIFVVINGSMHSSWYRWK